MKIFPLLPTLVFALGAAACGAPTPEPPSDPSTTVEDLSSPPDILGPEAAARAEALGAPAAQALAQGLVGRLSQALETDGPLGAVDFCSEEALSLTRAIQEGHDPTLQLKRPTLRYRNPANAPDAAEARMLRYLEALEAASPGSAPEFLTAAGPEGSLRFYRTLRTAPMCLQCHGTEGEIDPAVFALLKERYPEDRATGYAAGDFRGVIRVQIPGGEAP